MRWLEGGPWDDPPPAWPPRSVYLSSTQGLFGIPTGPRTAWQVIVWWERRRFLYNVFVFVACACSFPLFLFFVNRPILGDSRYVATPAGGFVLLVVANIAYTSGWVLELILRAVSPQRAETAGPKLLKAGLVLSALVIALPTLLVAAAVWLAQLHGRR